jgi:hypothetical protein
MREVMRVRCTRGMRISNFYGNFFIRGTDLLVCGCYIKLYSVILVQ